jgi:hypothetical protein
MTYLLFALWFVLTFGSVAWLLHEIGGVYGEHVARDMDTRIVVFVVCGSVFGLLLGAIRWFMS